MKIRIKTNSIRYRLTKSDVAKLMDNGSLEDSVDFDAHQFFYRIEAIPGNQLQATFNNNTITLLMPKTMVDELANTERVGFDNEDGKLFLLVEKDFTCLDNVDEDQSDNYPNPLAEKL